MNPLVHSLNIGTLAAWLSVSLFGTVGFMLPERAPSIQLATAEESTLIPEDFDMGDGKTDETPAAEPQATAPAEATPLPAPPEMPALAETAPLPDIPDLPAVETQPAEVAQPRHPTPRTSGSSSSHTSPRSSGGGNHSNGRARPGGNSISVAARMAAGTMPAPNYPAEARRKGQTGTVVVQFTVDSYGSVTFANAIRPSPWPLLNQEAVKTVLRWKFPPGGFITIERPIIFQLK